MFDCVTKYDWIVIFSNVIFFMVVQSLFFIAIASKQYENVLANKMDFVSRFVSKSSMSKQKLKDLKDTFLQQNIGIAEGQHKQRMQENKKYIKKFCVYPIMAAVAVLLCIIYYFKTDLPWTSIDSLNLTLVMLAYATELYFFFFIVRKFEFVGDHYIIANTFKEASN